MNIKTGLVSKEVLTFRLGCVLVLDLLVLDFLVLDRLVLDYTHTRLWLVLTSLSSAG